MEFHLSGLTIVSSALTISAVQAGPHKQNMRSTANPTTDDGPVLLGEGPVMEQLRTDIQTAARSDAKVMIGGETGVGKEVVTRFIHHMSARRRHPFMAINCAGLPDSLLESELFGHVRGSFTGAHRDK